MSTPHPRPPVDPALLNGVGSDSSWTNLGLWSGASTYPDAARALAAHVGHAAQLRRGDVVVDYGCGYGDSLRLWIEGFGAERVVGIEPDPELTRRVTQRVADWGLAERIRIVTARAEDVAPRAVATDVSAVVSVDAAYHFTTRSAWLSRVASDIGSDTRFALGDLVVRDQAARSWDLRAMARLMRIPRGNLWTAIELEDSIASAGLEITWSESVGEAVLDGFARHAPRSSLALRLTAAMLRLARVQRAVDYRVIGGVKRAASHPPDNSRHTAR